MKEKRSSKTFKKAIKAYFSFPSLAHSKLFAHIHYCNGYPRANSGCFPPIRVSVWCLGGWGELRLWNVFPSFSNNWCDESGYGYGVSIWCCKLPDSNQSLGQPSVIIGVACNTPLLAHWYWPKIGTTLRFP